MRQPIIVRGCIWQVREHCRRHRSLQRMLLARMLDRWEMKKVPAGRWRGPAGDQQPLKGNGR